MFFFFLSSLNSFSQSSLPYNKYFIESSTGCSLPLSDVSFSGEGQYISFSHIDMGIRYMFNKNWGGKSTFNFDAFNEDLKGTQQHRFNFGAFYNIGNWINLNYISNRSVVLYSHLGVGFTFNKTNLKGIKIGFIPGGSAK